LAEYLLANPEAREEWERTFKLACDPRITRFGAYLRRSSLDELPQLFNVLAGDMSLVGPRPIVPSEIERYADRIGAYYRCRPGITGLWQVSGRNLVSYSRRVRLDAIYARKQTMWLDVVILFRTVRVVLTGVGAC
jgi:undecaprenyl-phosphate galactose phosphotransferase